MNEKRVRKVRTSGARAKAVKASKRPKLKPVQRSPRPSRRIAAIGASAGGLEALEQFFDAQPTDTGLTFVIIQHLSPHFPSVMDELLARHSSMNIHQATAGTVPEPNAIYLRPARKTLTIENGRFQLADEDETSHLTLPIDAFLRSLADDSQEDAIAIILSGTGSDGTLGASAVRETGGTVLVQEPATARFESMPRSIVERNLASAIGEPAELAKLVSNLVSSGTLPEQTENGFRNDIGDPEIEIIRLLQRRCGTDFGYYKMSTVGRRIRRRAEIASLDNLGEYAAFLKEHPDEVDLLIKDLLIGVTAFFRDPEAFAALKQKALRTIASSMNSTRQFRVWVPGCATGEEAYSIAILLSELARELGTEPNIKVFATDIFEPALETAARGLYDESSLKEVPKELVERYFEEHVGKYQVRPSLRRQVVFSVHNILKDPPFTRMDLVSCRNMLIYFNEEAQRKVLTFFHFALHVNGTLFLGSSESLSDLSDEFGTIDNNWRIFRKLRDVRLRESLRMLPPTDLKSRYTVTAERMDAEALGGSFRYGGVLPGGRRGLGRAYDAVLARYAPPGVIVDRQGMILHVFGEAQEFLSIGEGLFSGQIADAVGEDLRHTINAGLERMRGLSAAPFSRTIHSGSPDDPRIPVTIAIERLAPDSADDGLCLVTFKLMQEAARPPKPPLQLSTPEADDIEFYRTRTGTLEHDLRVTEESLQATIEEMETTNEELQATNEELMSSNEELQSTNEELHSVNEELYTVSAEHQRKIDELLEVTADLDHLLTSSNIGVIYLDVDLCIRRYTPGAAKTFSLLERDIGRSIEDIRPRFNDFDLTLAIKEVRDTSKAGEHEVSVDDQTFVIRILPYKLSEKRVGYGITLINITDRKRAEVSLAASEERFRSTFENAAVGIAHVAPNGSWLRVNEKLCEIVGYSAKELQQIRFQDITHPEDLDPNLDLLARVMSGNSDSYQVEKRYIRKGGEVIWIKLSVSCVRGNESSDQVEYFIAIIEDISNAKKTKADLEISRRGLEISNEHLRRANAHLDQFAYIVSHDLRAPLRAVSNSAQWIVEDLADQADENIKGHVARLREHTDRMYRMLDDLLRYSRVGHEDGAPEIVDLGELTKEIAQSVPDSTKLVWEVQGPALQIFAPRGAIDLVLRNLIENSVRHHDRDKVMVGIRCVENCGIFEFEFQDDGPGIPIDHHQQIFMPFRKVGTNEKSDGSGMGLALVKRVIEDNGGRITVQSDPRYARGTVFRFSWDKSSAHQLDF